MLSLSTVRPIGPHATLLANPYFPNMPTQLPKLTNDFHLDTFFNPTWMAGPHVFSFSRSGTIVRPKATRPTVYPSSASALGPAPVGVRSYADAVKAAQFHSFSATEKPWKNVAITEQDDAEFEALTAIALQEQQAEMGEKEDGNSVYSWPPDLSPQQQKGEDAAGDAQSHCGDENDAPLSSYLASPFTSQESEKDSPMIPTPGARKDRFPFRILHERSPSFESESSPTLEKVVGFERLRRKAPPPLQLDLINLGDTSCVLFQSIEEIDASGRGNEVMERQVCRAYLSGQRRN
ncbi:hypothetical protein F5I97DRAFT_1342417 [Phlebopus sp. FC_14]|nr:hypothetical protein F5I97DRAFT_1342417 [Phlebopus sp. FC_14]